MRKLLLHLALGAALAGLGAEAGAGSTILAQDRPAPRAQAGAAQGDGAVSVAAIQHLDIDRLLSDRPYAEEILGHIGRVQSAVPNAREVRLELENLRLIALTTLERTEEARTAIDWVVSQRSTNPDHYFGGWHAAVSLDEIRRAIELVETASLSVPGVGWAGLREAFNREGVFFIFNRLRVARDEAGRVRLARGLFRIGWMGDEPGYSDELRGILLEDAVRRGDDREARNIAEAVTLPEEIAGWLVQRRYDLLFPAGADRVERLRRALAEHDRQTGEALAAAPTHRRRILDRAKLLRTLGRDADALALLGPFTSDVAAAASDEDGMWLVNEPSYALLQLGRRDEAVALMRQLAAMPREERSYLISASINYAEVLWEAGRFAESLAHARALEGGSADEASDYGDMWIRSSIVCALASLGRGGESAPVLGQMRAQRDSNPAALMRAYLCLDDLTAAEALLVSRLQGDEAEEALLALQDYLPRNPAAGSDPLYQRLLALRSRPAVRAAVERVGRILQLPVARTYWGSV